MTSYYEYLPANKIALAMEIESDRMQNSIFDPKEFASEIEVIKQERRMRSESSPQGVMNETLNAVAYQSHPNRDPIIGWPADLGRVTRDDAFTYYRTYYTPNNAFLVLVGDFASPTRSSPWSAPTTGKIPRVRQFPTCGASTSRSACGKHLPSPTTMYRRRHSAWRFMCPRMRTPTLRHSVWRP